MKRHIGWQNYFISGVLTLVFLVGIFYLKLVLGHSFSISMETLVIGGVVALLISAGLLLGKKPAVLFSLSVAALMVWVLLNGIVPFSETLLSGGAVGCIASLPFSAKILSGIVPKATESHS